MRAALAPLLVLAAACAEEAPPTVVLISLDSVRADALTFDDPEASPHLTALARRGVRFTQAVAGSSWTLPSHVQMFTGCPPSLHGVESDDVIIDPQDATLSEVLQEAGYATAGIFTGWYLSGEYGFARGFDAYRNAMTGAVEAQREFEAAQESGSTFDERRTQRDLSSHRDVNSGNVVAMAGELLAELDPDRPLFLFAHFFDPHYDFIPPPPWDSRFDPSYRGTLDGHDFWNNPRIFDLVKDPARQIGDRDLDHIRALYQGEIGWTDAAIGEILGLLGEHRRLQNALILVTSDHGEEFFEHGGRGHRSTLYDEQIHVPLLVVPPGSAAAAAEVAAQVSLSDLMPTILDFCDLPIPPSVFGSSLRDAVLGEAIASRPAVSSLYRWQPAEDGAYRHWLQHSLRLPESVFLRVTEVDPSGTATTPDIAYFDLRLDPQQLSPIRNPEHPDLRRAWRQLEDELDRQRAHHARHPSAPDTSRRTGVALTFADDLRALGYIGDDDADPIGRMEHLPWGLAPLPRCDPP